MILVKPFWWNDFSREKQIGNVGKFSGRSSQVNLGSFRNMKLQIDLNLMNAFDPWIWLYDALLLVK